MRWNLGELRDHVRRVHGEDQLRIVNSCLRTVGDRRQFSHYHFNEAMHGIDAVVKDRQDFEMTGVILGAFDDEPGQFDNARFRAYAHITACVQNMHALADNLVHLVYYTLGLNLDPGTRIARERHINWTRVDAALRPSPIKVGLQTLINDPGFVYLDALNNHSKHRTMIEVAYAVSFVEEDAVSHGLRFISFSYEGESYPQRWVRPTLVDEYQRQETQILTIGNALNQALIATP